MKDSHPPTSPHDIAVQKTQTLLLFKPLFSVNIHFLQQQSTRSTVCVNCVLSAEVADGIEATSHPAESYSLNITAHTKIWLQSIYYLTLFYVQ